MGLLATEHAPENGKYDGGATDQSPVGPEVGQVRANQVHKELVVEG